MVVTETCSLEEFLAYLEKAAKEKWIYIWGGQGESVPDMTFRKAFNMETSKENFARVLKHLASVLVSGDFDFYKCRCVDCSGLSMYFLEDMHGILKWDHNAKALYKEGIVIDPLMAQPGDFVYKSFDSEGPQHVGYIVEGNCVIESYGRDKGVIKRSFAEGKWVKVARQPYFAYKMTRKLKSGMKGNDVGQLQARLKSFGYDCGEVDNLFGEKTKKALVSFQNDKGIEKPGTMGEKTAKALLFTWAAA